MANIKLLCRVGYTRGKAKNVDEVAKTIEQEKEAGIWRVTGHGAGLQVACQVE